LWGFFVLNEKVYAMKNEIVWIYVLESVNTGKRYTGMCLNLENRLSEHNHGKSKFTSSFAPWKIIYTEKAIGWHDARKREKYLKFAAGRAFVKKILSVDGSARRMHILANYSCIFAGVRAGFRPEPQKVKSPQVLVGFFVLSAWWGQWLFYHRVLRIVEQE
jgi:predicted GIY-YIG superfamily endonuclease